MDANPLLNGPQEIRRFDNTSELHVIAYVHRDTLEPLHTLSMDATGDEWSAADALIDAEIGDVALATGIPPGSCWDCRSAQRRAGT